MGRKSKEIKQEGRRIVMRLFRKVKSFKEIGEFNVEVKKIIIIQNAPRNDRHSKLS